MTGLDCVGNVVENRDLFLRLDCAAAELYSGDIRKPWSRSVICRSPSGDGNNLPFSVLYAVFLR